MVIGLEGKKKSRREIKKTREKVDLNGGMSKIK